ncbi:MAG: cysteine hydrolase [Azospirillaceae bacterium]
MTGSSLTAGWPPLVPPFDPVDASTALLLVDLQVFDCARDRGWGPVLASRYPELYRHYYDRLDRIVLPRLSALLRTWRSHGLPVIHLSVGPHLADGSDMLGDRTRATGAAVPPVPPFGTPDHAAMPELAPDIGELRLNKTTRSAFTSTGIDAHLRQLGMRQLIIGGVLTNSCVESTARDATDRGYRVTLLADGAASFDRESHEASLACFARLFGAVAQCGDIVARLDGTTDRPIATTTTTGDLS